MIRDAHTNPNPVSSDRRGDGAHVDAQVAQLEQTIEWLLSRSPLVSEAQAKRIGAVGDKAALLRADVNDRIDRQTDPRRPDLQEDDWVTFEGQPHRVIAVQRNPVTGGLLWLRLQNLMAGSRFVMHGVGVEKIR